MLSNAYSHLYIFSKNTNNTIKLRYTSTFPSKLRFIVLSIPSTSWRWNRSSWTITILRFIVSYAWHPARELQQQQPQEKPKSQDPTTTTNDPTAPSKSKSGFILKPSLLLLASYSYLMIFHHHNIDTMTSRNNPSSSMLCIASLDSSSPSRSFGYVLTS